MIKDNLLDLTLFDGEAETGGEPVQAEPAADTAEGQDAADTSEEAEEDLDKEFDSLIKGKFKEQYKARQQKAIQSRFRENSTEKAQLESANRLKDAIAVRYGMQDASADDLLKAIDADDTFLEEAAAKEGLSPEQFRKMSEMQQRAMAAERKADEATRARIQADVNARLEQQCSECTALFPNFDFEEECRNEAFTNLVKQGVDVTSAYKFAHMDELMADGMAKAVQRGAKETANAVRANLGRPAESGIKSGAATAFSVDFDKMSSEDFLKYTEKVMAGEI